MKLALKLAAAAAVMALATPALACDGMKAKTAEKQAKAAPASVATTKAETRPAKVEARKAEAKTVTTAAN
jgi:hypothetical protein